MRLFIAIDLPLSIKRKLVEAQELLPKDVKRVKKENLHITLLFLGEKSPKQYIEIKNKLNELSFPVFKVVVKGVGAFPSRQFCRVLWAGCESKELESLHKRICETLGVVDQQEYKGHITLARNQRKYSFNKFFNSLQGKTFGSFKAREVLLVESTLTQKGAKYSIRDRFELEEE